MDHSSSQQDVEFQSIQNTMDEMIEKITKDQPENSVVKTQEKDTGKKSENTVCSQELSVHDVDIYPTLVEDKVSQKKPNDCKFHAALSSIFDVDEDVRFSIDKICGSERRNVNTDYIPLSCPTIKSNTDSMLSEKDKSFLKFLDDMQSLTTKERCPSAVLERRPVFSDNHGNHLERQLQHESDEELSICEQTGLHSSDKLTLQALLNSQESQHQIHYESSDYEEQDITTLETQPLFSSYSGNQRRENGSAYMDGHTLKTFTKDVMVPSGEDVLEENESTLNLDNKPVDSVPLCADDTVDDPQSSQPLFLEETQPVHCLDEHSERQLKNVYSAVDANVTETKTELKQPVLDTHTQTTNVANSGSRHRALSSACFEYDSDKENQQSHDGRESQSESNNETTRLQTGYTDPLTEDCEQGNADQIKCSSRAEQIHDQSANTEHKSENEISGMEPAPFSLFDREQSGGHVQEARIDDTDEGDPGNVDNVVMSRNHGNRNPAAAQILQNPEMTTRNNSRSSQMVLYFKEQTDSPSSNIEAGSTVLEELCSAEQMETVRFQEEDNPTSPKDNKIVAQIPNYQIQENYNVAKIFTDKFHEDSCSLQGSPWRDQSGAEFLIRCNMERASQSQNFRSELSTREDTDTAITQNQCESVLQQPINSHQISEVTVPGFDEGEKKLRVYAPSSHAVNIHDEKLDTEIISSHVEQCSFPQNKVIQGVPDQMVPDQSYLVRDCQEKTYIQAEPEPDESLYGSEQSKLKEAKLPSPLFKRKYRPSCDGEDEDLVTPVEEMQLDVLGNIQPLLIGQCSRSLRIGLSRKQKVKRLHKNVN